MHKCGTELEWSPLENSSTLAYIHRWYLLLEGDLCKEGANMPLYYEAILASSAWLEHTHMLVN